MAQSRVSRHLGILRDAAVVRDRREGTFVLYQLALPADGPWRAAWEVAVADLRARPGQRARPGRPRPGPRGAQPRGAAPSSTPSGPSGTRCARCGATTCSARARSRRLVPDGLRVVDVGTGTGVLALELARLGVRVVAVDRSSRMLDGRARAASRPQAPPASSCAPATPRRCPSPTARSTRPSPTWCSSTCPRRARRCARWRASCARAAASSSPTSPATSAHWMREELGVLRLGFGRGGDRAGFFDGRRASRPSASRSSRRRRGAPTCRRTFIASARRPGGAR